MVQREVIRGYLPALYDGVSEKGMSINPCEFIHFRLSPIHLEKTQKKPQQIYFRGTVLARTPDTQLSLNQVPVFVKITMPDIFTTPSHIIVSTLHNFEALTALWTSEIERRRKIPQKQTPHVPVYASHILMRTPLEILNDPAQCDALFSDSDLGECNIYEKIAYSLQRQRFKKIGGIWEFPCATMTIYEYIEGIPQNFCTMFSMSFCALRCIASVWVLYSLYRIRMNDFHLLNLRIRHCDPDKVVHFSIRSFSFAIPTCSYDFLLCDLEYAVFEKFQGIPDFANDILRTRTQSIDAFEKMFLPPSTYRCLWHDIYRIGIVCRNTYAVRFEDLLALSSHDAWFKICTLIYFPTIDQNFAYIANNIGDMFANDSLEDLLCDLFKEYQTNRAASTYTQFDFDALSYDIVTRMGASGFKTCTFQHILPLDGSTAKK